MSAGYSGTPLPRKLGIGPGSRVAVRGALPDAELPGVEPAGEPPWDVLLAFFAERADLAARCPRSRPR